MERIGDEILTEIFKYLSLKDRVLSTMLVNSEFERATHITLRKSLSFEDEHWVTSANVQKLLRLHPASLKFLNFKNCYWFLSQDFKPIVHCVNITNLQLIGCTTITGKCLLHILSGLTKLKTFSMTATDQLVTEVVKELKKTRLQVPFEISTFHLYMNLPKVAESMIKQFISGFIVKCLLRSNGTYLENFTLAEIKTCTRAMGMVLPLFLNVLHTVQTISLNGCIGFDELLRLNVPMITASFQSFMEILTHDSNGVVFKLDASAPHNLINIGIRFNIEVGNTTVSRKKVVLPHLKSISILDGDLSILDRFEAEMLEKIKFPFPRMVKNKWVNDLSFFHRFPNLKNLNLLGWELPCNAELPDTPRTKLKTIRLSLLGNCGLSTNVLTHLLVPNLTRVELCGYAMTTKGRSMQGEDRYGIAKALEGLSRLQSLKHLKMGQLLYLRDFQFLILVAMACKKLTKLDLCDLGPMTIPIYIKSVHKMLPHMPQLEHLRLHHLYCAVDEKLTESLRNCTNLTTLKLSTNCVMNQDGAVQLAKIAEQCERLVLLSICCKSIPKSAMATINRLFKPLKKKRQALRLEVN